MLLVLSIFPKFRQTLQKLLFESVSQFVNSNVVIPLSHLLLLFHLLHCIFSLKFVGLGNEFLSSDALLLLVDFGILTNDVLLSSLLLLRTRTALLGLLNFPPLFGRCLFHRLFTLGRVARSSWRCYCLINPSVFGRLLSLRMINARENIICAGVQPLFGFLFENIVLTVRLRCQLLLQVVAIRIHFRNIL